MNKEESFNVPSFNTDTPVANFSLPVVDGTSIASPFDILDDSNEYAIPPIDKPPQPALEGHYMEYRFGHLSTWDHLISNFVYFEHDPTEPFCKYLVYADLYVPPGSVLSISI